MPPHQHVRMLGARDGESFGQPPRGNSIRHLLKDVCDVRVKAFVDLEVDVLDVELEGSYILRPYNVGIADIEVDLSVVREPSTIEPSIWLPLLLVPPVPLLLDPSRSSERNESIAGASRDTGSSTTSSVHSI